MQFEWAHAQTEAVAKIGEGLLVMRRQLLELQTKHNALCLTLETQHHALAKRLTDFFEAELRATDEIAQRIERQEQYLEEVRQHLGLGQTSTSAPKVAALEANVGPLGQTSTSAPKVAALDPNVGPCGTCGKRHRVGACP